MPLREQYRLKRGGQDVSEYGKGGSGTGLQQFLTHAYPQVGFIPQGLGGMMIAPRPGDSYQLRTTYKVSANVLTVESTLKVA